MPATAKKTAKTPAKPDTTKMVLIAVHVLPDQHQALAETARLTGASVAFQVRQAVAEHLARRQGRDA